MPAASMTFVGAFASCTWEPFRRGRALYSENWANLSALDCSQLAPVGPKQ